MTGATLVYFSKPCINMIKEIPMEREMGCVDNDVGHFSIKIYLKKNNTNKIVVYHGTSVIMRSSSVLLKFGSTDVPYEEDW